MARLIIPNRYVTVKKPLIFLAGPIRGAAEWQDNAINYIASQTNEVDIASPRRYIRSAIEEFVQPDENESYFPRQRKWERHYLDIAGETGCIAFWLCEEDEHLCEKPFGSMSRFELGKYTERMLHKPNFKACLGTDGKFPDYRSFETDLLEDNPDIKVKDSLEETCDEAIRIALSR